MDVSRYNPLKVLRWNDRIKATLAGVATGPIRASIDLTNLCNHKCSWCEPLQYREHTIADRKHTLAADVVVELLKDLSEMGCKGITFSGGGEPTLHREFGQVLWTAHNYGMRTFVITNGSRLEMWRSTFLSDVDEFRVSLDASCEEEHMAIHRSKEGGFSGIIEGVKAIAAARKADKPRIGLAYTMEPKNWQPHSLSTVMKLAEDLRVDYLLFRPESSLDVDLEVSYEYIRIQKESHCPSVEVVTQSWRNTDVLHQREFDKCYSALTVAVIGANGDVQACCDRRDIVFGNVYDTPFKKIWLSREHREAASQIKPKECVRCLQCGTNKAIESYIVRNDAVVEHW